MPPFLSTSRSTLAPLIKSVPYSWPCVATYLHIYKCVTSLAFCFPSNYNNLPTWLSLQLGHELHFPYSSFSWAWLKLPIQQAVQKVLLNYLLNWLIGFSRPLIKYMLGEEKQDRVIRQFIITISLISQLSLWRSQQAEGKLKGYTRLVGSNRSWEQGKATLVHPCLGTRSTGSSFLSSLPYQLLALITNFYSFIHSLIQ